MGLLLPPKAFSDAAAQTTLPVLHTTTKYIQLHIIQFQARDDDDDRREGIQLDGV